MVPIWNDYSLQPKENKQKQNKSDGASLKTPKLSANKRAIAFQIIIVIQKLDSQSCQKALIELGSPKLP